MTIAIGTPCSWSQTLQHHHVQLWNLPLSQPIVLLGWLNLPIMGCNDPNKPASTIPYISDHQFCSQESAKNSNRSCNFPFRRIFFSAPLPFCERAQRCSDTSRWENLDVMRHGTRDVGEPLVVASEALVEIYRYTVKHLKLYVYILYITYIYIYDFTCLMTYKYKVHMMCASDRCTGVPTR